MARIKPSVIVSDIRGKIQGSLFQNSAAGLILKANNKKTNKNSLAQSNLKNITNVALNQWLGLTDTQRMNWDRFAGYVRVQQVNNANFIVNGQQMFIKANVSRLLYGLSVLIDPQYSRCITLPVSFSVALVTGDLILTSSRLVDSLVEYVVCRASFPVSPSLNNPGSRLRTLIFSTSTDTDFDITSAYINIFGRAPVANDVIFTQAWVQNLYTGLNSQKSVEKTTL